jgi:4-hydroxybenzoate polyprenyltransferase
MTLRPYVELVRPPNVTTAVADVLAGYAVAGASWPGSAPWLLGSTVCLYAGGIVLNDVFDADLDRLERPERPIPSGRVTRRAAAGFGGTLLITGAGLAWGGGFATGVVAAATALCILLYDAVGKRQPWGPVNMGLCRAGNLLLGVAATPTSLRWAWPLAMLPLTYIAAVTAVSRGEVHGGNRPVAAFALISLGAVLLALLWLSSIAHWSIAGLLLVAALAVRVVPPFARAWHRPAAATTRLAVRSGVLSLMLLDAVLGAVYAGPLYAAAIVVTALAAGWLARRFAVT